MMMTNLITVAVCKGSLTQLEVEGDPAWESVQTRYRLTFELMETCKNSHAKLDETSALRPAPALASSVSGSPAGGAQSWGLDN